MSDCDREDKAIRLTDRRDRSEAALKVLQFVTLAETPEGAALRTAALRFLTQFLNGEKP